MRGTHLPTIKGESVRHLRNTSDKTVLKTNLNDFKPHLEKRGYEESEIEPIWQEITVIKITDLLNKSNLKNKENGVPNVMITNQPMH